MEVKVVEIYVPIPAPVRMRMFRDLRMRSAWKLSHNGDTSATVRRADEDRGDNGAGFRGARGRYPYRTNKRTEPIYCFEGISLRDELAVNR